MLFLHDGRKKRENFGRVMFCSLLFICLVLTHHILFHYCSKFCFISWLQFQSYIDKDKRNNNNCLLRMENICKCTRHNFFPLLFLLLLSVWQLNLFYSKLRRQSSRLYKMQKRQQRQQRQQQQQKNLQNIQKLLKFTEKKNSKLK